MCAIFGLIDYNHARELEHRDYLYLDSDGVYQAIYNIAFGRRFFIRPHVGDLRYCRIINVCLCQPTFDKKRVIYRLNLKVSFYEVFISFTVLYKREQRGH